MTIWVIYEAEDISLLCNTTISSAISFYVFYWNLKEKYHFRGKIKSKNKKCLYVKSISIIILTVTNSGWSGPYNKKLSWLHLRKWSFTIPEDFLKFSVKQEDIIKSITL